MEPKRLYSPLKLWEGVLRFGTREITAAAIMAALVCVATLLIQIPIPATQGFFNVGDVIVMVSALTFGPIVGFFAGGVGSSLADFLGGWYVWVPFTLVIKGIEGFLAGAIMVLDGEEAGAKKRILAWLVAGLEMVVGYFLVQYYMYGFGAALTELPFNILQMAVGGIIGVPLSMALTQRIKL
jgi:uncharacterized membrane protein